MFRKCQKVIFIAPHTDDIELGCGGTMARLIEEGHDVYAVAFSTAEESLPLGAKPGTLKDEFMNSMCNIMNLPVENISVFNYPVRRLCYHRQEILENMISLKKKLKPDLVFAPSTFDLHQDHQTVASEAVRAFKDISLMGYELPWNNINFSAQAFVILEKRHIEKKWQALQEYKSQLMLKRGYFSEDYIWSLARIRGQMVKSDWAEAFEVMRMTF